ncbi:hypothetical protein [Micromonospora vulcania]|uniref:Uncharacterized protein n=1 Tax=Micromonospora vulcania TaxID=1441873 RepID=A0ABW1H218_9ACTN
MRFPGDAAYAVGVAKIGDEVRILAPLCDDERISIVEVYDNQAALERTGSRTGEPTLAPYWKVADPHSDAAAKGEFVIGRDSSFTRVLVLAKSGAVRPEISAVEITVLRADRRHVVGDAFRLKEVPEFQSGTDAKSVKYVYDQGANSEKLLTPSQISEESGCAFDYVA